MALDASIGHVPTDVEAPCTSDFGFYVVPFFPSGSLLRIHYFRFLSENLFQQPLIKPKSNLSVAAIPSRKHRSPSDQP